MIILDRINSKIACFLFLYLLLRLSGKYRHTHTQWKWKNIFNIASENTHTPNSIYTVLSFKRCSITQKNSCLFSILILFLSYLSHYPHLLQFLTSSTSSIHLTTSSPSAPVSTSFSYSSWFHSRLFLSHPSSSVPLPADLLHLPPPLLLSVRGRVEP